jgi:chromosome partitioning protein
LGVGTRQDAPVSDAPDDLASRGLAIFQRLREQQGVVEPEEAPAAPDADAAIPSEPTPDDDELRRSGPVDRGEGHQEPGQQPSEPEGVDPEGETAPAPGPESASTPADDEPASDATTDESPTMTDPPPEADDVTGGERPSPTVGEEPHLSDEELEAFTAPPPEHIAPVVVPVRGPLPGAEDLLGLGGEVEGPGADTVEPVVAAPMAIEPPVGSAFARPLPRIMAVANQKGGVGKTTTAVNLGACLADIGYRVLVVDLDPQGNASTGLGINIRDLQGSMYDVVLHDLPIEDCVEATSVRNLFCAPSSLDLAGAEIELVPAFSRELRLKRALHEVRDDYDFVLIDCPPSLGLLTVNGLAAATEVVVPIQCEYYALEGLGQLLRNVNLVQKNLNPQLEVSAIILVMYDARTKLADQVVTEVREHFGPKVCRNVVPRTVRLSEAPSFGQPIIAFDPSSRGAIAYRELAKEVSGGTPQRAR